jgi:hypothetical protein
MAAQGVTPVRINEVSAANGIYVNDFFKRNDWVELYNTTDQDIDVEGMYLSDNPAKPLKYQIALSDDAAYSSVIPAHGYLVVWCDKLQSLSQLHASFKLAAEGGEVLITAADQSWTDHLSYGLMKADETIGRYPDGADQVFSMNVPTIARANLTSSYSVLVEQNVHDGILDMAGTAQGLTVRYAGGNLVVRAASDGEIRVSIVNMAGQRVAALSALSTLGCAEVPVGMLTTGAYAAVVSDACGNKVVCKFIR